MQHRGESPTHSSWKLHGWLLCSSSNAPHSSKCSNQQSVAKLGVSTMRLKSNEIHVSQQALRILRMNQRNAADQREECASSPPCCTSCACVFGLMSQIALPPASSYCKELGLKLWRTWATSLTSSLKKEAGVACGTNTTSFCVSLAFLTGRMEKLIPHNIPVERM